MDLQLGDLSAADASIVFHDFRTKTQGKPRNGDLQSDARDPSGGNHGSIALIGSYECPVNQGNVALKIN